MRLNNIKTIGILPLSGTVEEDKICLAKENLEKLGFEVKLSSNIFDKKRYLAGKDETKLENLYNFFKDPQIDLILCARGGYGAIRLINKIDYEALKKHPKPFCGFSDVTALLLMIYKKTGMKTFHAPMASSDFGVGEICGFTLKSFEDAINNKTLEFSGDKTYFCGSAQGKIWGGNLATVVSLCGQDFLPDEDFIFFAEDLNEPVYKIDKMFQQLINIEKFRQNCKGIVLGSFSNVDNTTWLEEYFSDLAEELKIPTVSGFKITHDLEKITIPIGNNAELKENCLVISPKESVLLIAAL